MQTDTIKTHANVKNKKNNISPKHQIDLLNDEDFKQKLESVYNLLINRPELLNIKIESIPLKFGAAKNIIEYVSDDFDAPLNEEFKEYVQ